MKYFVNLIILICTALALSSFPAFGQDALEDNEGEDEEEGRHTIFLGFGWTHIPKAGSVDDTEATGFLVPTIGLDYMYKISPKWEVGTMMDLELDQYLIIDQELERENAVIITAIGLYRLLPHLSIFAGGGIEIEHHKNLAIFRAGIDSPFHLGKGWFLVPSFIVDFKEGYDTWSFKVSFGKEF